MTFTKDKLKWLGTIVAVLIIAGAAIKVVTELVGPK